MAITSVTDADGFAQINLVNIDILNKDWIIITGTTNYNGSHQVRAALPTHVIIDFPFGANETGTAQRYYQNYTTIIQINAGIAPNHEFAASDPISLIGTIEQRPDTDNITLADVRDYVKNKLNTNYNEDQSSWPNDLNGWTDFYIAWAERYDDSDGTDVTDFTSAFTNDEESGNIIYLHAVHGALQFGNARGGNMFDHVIFGSAYFDSDAKFMTFFERLKLIDDNNFNLSIIFNQNGEYPNLNIVRTQIKEFDINGTFITTQIFAIPRQDYGLYRIDNFNDLTFNPLTNYLEIVILDGGDIELSETKIIDIEVSCSNANQFPQAIFNFGNGIKLDQGTANYMENKDLAARAFPDDGYFEFWMKINNDGPAFLGTSEWFSTDEDTSGLSNNEALFDIAASRWRTTIWETAGNNLNIISTSNIVDWDQEIRQHIILTWEKDGATWDYYLYLDSVLQNSVLNSSVNLTTFIEGIFLGKVATAGRHSFNFGIVRHAEQLLSQANVDTLYNSGAGSFGIGTRIFEYDFDEVIGGDTIEDKSGNGFDLTIIGSFTEVAF